MSDGLREYRLPGKGLVVLACGKCQRKMTGKLGKVKKAVKKRVGDKVRVMEVGCLNVCPKGGVVVCTQEQVGRGACSIVWSGKDLGFLVARVIAGAGDLKQATTKTQCGGSLHFASVGMTSLYLVETS